MHSNGVGADRQTQPETGRTLVGDISGCRMLSSDGYTIKRNSTKNAGAHRHSPPLAGRNGVLMPQRIRLSSVSQDV